jgi:NTE family protein
MSISVYSQEAPQNDVKVGLVLSGGGAKGLAHIGVLKTIDSLGIHIDHIAGTSMGAIIGSLYASGYKGKQLDSIFNSLNFDDLINDHIPRASRTFYEKEQAEKYAITLPFNNFKVSLPSAISKGQNVFNLLSRLTMHVDEIEDFNKLPTPFFCMATDAETGQSVILDSGNLAQSVRASGALPSLFQPVYINDRMLIDGGVTNNYPLNELKAKGVDLIIGVDVQDDLLDRKELKSAPGILLQINNYRTIRDMRLKSELTDIYIKPDIKDFNVVSFNQGKAIIKNGEQAALTQIVKLKEITENQRKKPLRVIQPPQLDSLKIKTVSINGNKKYSRSYILGKLKLKKNQTISYDDFIKGVNNLVATNNFDDFSYQFRPFMDGYILTANIKESETKTLLKAGLHYDDLYKSAALINLTHKRLLFNNDLTSIDFVLGDNIRYNFEYYIDKGLYWSIGLKSRLNTFNKNVSAALLLPAADLESNTLNKIDVDLVDFTNQAYMQTLFKKEFRLRIGAELKHLKFDSETFLENTGDDKIVFENSDFFSLFGNLKYDTFDNRYFPSKGFYFNGDFNLYLYSSDYNDNFSEFSIAKADIGYAFKVSDKFSIHINTQGGFKIGDNSVSSLNFALGGYGNNFINNFISFYGYDFISITGNSFVKGTINLDYQIFKKNHIIFSTNIANAEDNIFDAGEWITDPDFSGYALGYSLETFLGPIEAKYSYSPETKEGHWFFNLGLWF